MSVSITLNFATSEDAQEALAKLTGTSLDNAVLHVPHGETEQAPAKRGRKPASETKATAAAQTVAANPAPKAPAAKAPTLDEIKKEIAAWAGTGDAETIKNKVTTFVRSFGVAKMSDTTDAIRQQMRDKIAEDDGAGETEPNIMD